MKDKPHALHSELARLRTFRNRPQRDTSIAGDCEAVRKQLVRHQNAAGGLDLAWMELVPPQLLAQSSAVRLTPGGILTVQVSDTVALYEVDQWLRSGGLAALRARSSVTLRRVKLVLQA